MTKWFSIPDRSRVGAGHYTFRQLFDTEEGGHARGD
jgi:hypothetical protein